MRKGQQIVVQSSSIKNIVILPQSKPHIDQRNRTEVLNIILHRHRFLIFDKQSKNMFYIKTATGFLSITLYNTHLQMNQGPHYTTSTLKLLEYKVGIVSQHTGIDMNSLNIRNKISNLLMGYFKTKNFRCSKGHCQ